MTDPRILFAQAKSLRTLRDRVLFLLVAFTGKPLTTVLSWTHKEARESVNVDGFEYRKHLVLLLDKLQGSEAPHVPAFASRKGRKALGRVQAWRLLSVPVAALRGLGVALARGVIRALKVFKVDVLTTVEDDLVSFLASIPAIRVPGRLLQQV